MDVSAHRLRFTTTMMRTVVACFVALSPCGCSNATVVDVDATVEYPAPPPAPDGGYPFCSASTTAEAGPCCEQFFCLGREDGGLCPAVGDPQVYSASSGGCSCGETTGPYADDAGSCCYIARAEACQ